MKPSSLVLSSVRSMGSSDAAVPKDASSELSSFVSSAGYFLFIFSISSRVVPSLRMTVWKSAKGLLTSSLRTLSGRNPILECPEMVMRSPVFTFTLSLSCTSTSLKVPRAFTFTDLSARTPFPRTSKNVRTNASASLRGMPALAANSAARSCQFILFPFITWCFSG